MAGGLWDILSQIMQGGQQTEPPLTGVPSSGGVSPSGRLLAGKTFDLFRNPFQPNPAPPPAPSGGGGGGGGGIGGS